MSSPRYMSSPAAQPPPVLSSDTASSSNNLSPISHEPAINNSTNSRTGRTRNSISSAHILNRSPIRVPNQSTLSNSQRLRNSSIQSSNSVIGSQRRSSLNTSDFSSNLGMPYAYTINNGPHFNTQYSLNSGSTMSSSRTPAHEFKGSISSKSSPRSSFSSYDAVNGTDIGSRRYSEYSTRKPSTEEVFDLMEREQDAIVLKLMREISQLKEDNKALLSTIKHLTSGNGGYGSRSNVSSRRNSSAIVDELDNSSRVQPVFNNRKDLKSSDFPTTN